MFDLIPWDSSFHPDSVQDNAHKLKGSTWALCFVGCNGDTKIGKGQEHAGQALLARLLKRGEDVDGSMIKKSSRI